MPAKRYKLTFDLYDGTKKSVVFEVPEGEKGNPGYNPVRGKDYYTEADKAEIVNSVLSALPVYGGETE